MDELYDQIGCGFEESACCLQETVLIMAVWKEGDGPSRTINRVEFKLKVVRGVGAGGVGWGGVTCQK